MKKSGTTRHELLAGMAQFVLRNGLEAASLRPLARAAGTSDRMLIYHFGSKERLVTELMGYLADFYAEALDRAFGEGRAATRQECVARVMNFTRDPAVAPFLALWWEIVAGATRGKGGYREAGRSMMWLLFNWMKEQLPVDDPDPEGGARYLLTLIEGALMLEAVDCGEIARSGLGNA